MGVIVQAVKKADGKYTIRWPVDNSSTTEYLASILSKKFELRLETYENGRAPPKAKGMSAKRAYAVAISSAALLARAGALRPRLRPLHPLLSPQAPRHIFTCAPSPMPSPSARIRFCPRMLACAPSLALVLACALALAIAKTIRPRPPALACTPASPSPSPSHLRMALACALLPSPSHHASHAPSPWHAPSPSLSPSPSTRPRPPSPSLALALIHRALARARWLATYASQGALGPCLSRAPHGALPLATLLRSNHHNTQWN